MTNSQNDKFMFLKDNKAIIAIIFITVVFSIISFYFLDNEYKKSLLQSKQGYYTVYEEELNKVKNSIS